MRTPFLKLFPFLLLLVVSCSQQSNPSSTTAPPDLTDPREGFWEDANAILEEGDSAGAYLVMEAVGDLEDPKGLPLLVTGLSREEGVVRARAAQSYAKFKDADPAPLRPLLKDPDLEARLWGAGALAALGVQEGRVLLEDFLKDSKPFLDETAAAGEEEGGRTFRTGYYRAIAGAALSAAGGDGKAAIREALSNPYPQARNPAVLALLQLGEKDAVPLFQEGMKDGQFSPRMVVYLYPLAPTVESLMPAITLFAREQVKEDPSQAAVGAWALAKVGVKEVITFLEKSAESEDLELRFLARWALLSPKLSVPAPSIDPALFTPPPDSPSSDSQPSDSQPHHHH